MERSRLPGINTVEDFDELLNVIESAEDDIIRRLRTAGFEYDEDINQFR